MEEKTSHKIEYIPKWFSLHINCDGFNNMFAAAKRIYSIPNLSFLHNKKSLIDLYNLENKKTSYDKYIAFFLFMPCQSTLPKTEKEDKTKAEARAERTHIVRLAG